MELVTPSSFSDHRDYAAMTCDYGDLLGSRSLTIVKAVGLYDCYVPLTHAILPLSSVIRR
jgi:hypothetical protein